MERISMEAKGEKSSVTAAASSAHVLIFPCTSSASWPCKFHAQTRGASIPSRYPRHIPQHRVHPQTPPSFQAVSECYPKPFLIFIVIRRSIPDSEHGRAAGDVIMSMNLYAKPLLRDIIMVSESPGIPKISCVVQDGSFGSLTTDLAAEFGIQLVHFRTISACCFWAYFCVPKLFERNELPITGDEDMDRIISNMPGMENLLRCRDLPSFCRSGNKSDDLPLDSIVQWTQQSLEADALILNTFEELEAPVLSQIRLHFPKLYTLGPLHHHLNTRKTAAKTSFKSNLCDVDRSCMAWLDAQPQRSVIYVSFGSTTPLKSEQLVEIWHGLVSSKKRFLWVMRPDMGSKEYHVPEEGTRERGLIVEWAPQDEVLAHWAVGGFLTHSGWNSTLESVCAGVPMICWPYFADQQVNSRFVSEVWRLGLDMKDVCDRNVVENMVNDVMVHRSEKFLRSAQKMAELACKSVSPGGSSYTNLDDLIQFIKSTSSQNH